MLLSIVVLLCSWWWLERESCECPRVNLPKHGRHLKCFTGVKKKGGTGGHYNRYCIGNLYSIHTWISSNSILALHTKLFFSIKETRLDPSQITFDLNQTSMRSTVEWQWSCKMLTAEEGMAICGALKEDWGQRAPLDPERWGLLEILAYFSCLCQKEHFGERFNTISRRVFFRCPPIGQPIVVGGCVWGETGLLNAFSAHLCNNGFSLTGRHSVVELLSLLLHNVKIKWK